MDSATATPFDIDCGNLGNVDTDRASTLVCTICDIGVVTELNVVLNNVVLNTDDLAVNPYANDPRAYPSKPCTASGMSLATRMIGIPVILFWCISSMARGRSSKL